MLKISLPQSVTSHSRKRSHFHALCCHHTEFLIKSLQTLDSSSAKVQYFFIYSVICLFQISKRTLNLLLTVKGKIKIEIEKRKLFIYKYNVIDFHIYELWIFIKNKYTLVTDSTKSLLSLRKKMGTNRK